MITFNKVYSFNVLDEIKNGKTVYVLDRLDQTIDRANTMKAEMLLSILEDANQNNRYDFWIEIKTEKENDSEHI